MLAGRERLSEEQKRKTRDETQSAITRNEGESRH